MNEQRCRTQIITCGGGGPTDQLKKTSKEILANRDRRKYYAGKPSGRFYKTPASLTFAFASELHLFYSRNLTSLAQQIKLLKSTHDVVTDVLGALRGCESLKGVLTGSLQVPYSPNLG